MGRWIALLLLAVPLPGCDPGGHPVTERFTIVNARPHRVYVDARCDLYRLEVFRAGTDGALERVRHFTSHCGVCGCDEACSCPPCGECSLEPVTLPGNTAVAVVWSGQEFSRRVEPRCGAPCQQGAPVPPGRYLARLCHSPWHFSSAEVVERSRRLVCTWQPFDPYADVEVVLELLGGQRPCEHDGECPGGEVCNVSTTLRDPDGALRSGMDGEGVCRRTCANGCGADEACTATELLRDGVSHEVWLCLPGLASPFEPVRAE
ncbi:MAG: hypothetical protein ACK4N5_04590 [Myxococcales bacterium]